MKKSNKLLLGGFLTVMLMITGIHIALFAKYKNGNYTIYHAEDRRAQYPMQSFPNVSFVTIRDMRGVTIQFGDIAEVEKDKEDVMQYVQKGDSLVITGRDVDDLLDGGRLVNLTLPYNVSLSVLNSLISFEKGKKTAGINPVIYLQNSRALFVETKDPLLLEHVKLIASDKSIAAFHGNTQVTNLEVQLTNSTLEYNEGDAGQLSIVTDSVSRLSLQTKHFLKAKITTIPSNP
jgi:hypothetical protein